MQWKKSNRLNLQPNKEVMKKFLLAVALITGLHTTSYAYPGTWQKVDSKSVITSGERVLFPLRCQVYSLNTSYLKSVLNNVSADPQQASVVELPMADGSLKRFHIWQTPVLPAALAERYPEIRTFTAVAVGDKNITAKIDMTYSGFHAMVIDGKNMSFVDPYSNGNDGYYLAYYRHDYGTTKEHRMRCEVPDSQEDELKQERLSVTGSGLPNVQLKTSGATRKTYRLALAATAEYSAAVGGSSPTKSSVLSAMTTSINRVNGVYERELSVTLQLVSNNDQLIYLANPDPYSNGSGPAMQGENQNNIDAVIGVLNYDIGHVFSTGGGGIAEVGCVCNNTLKARGVTGRSNPVGDPFDLDYVAHEIGHQFGGTHTFNASSGSCGGSNIDINSSYEPGSGSTLMAYAGICGAANNLQGATSVYFHSKSLEQMTDFINSPFEGGLCPATTASGNTPATLPTFTQQYYIPFKTPFELTAPEAVDADHDELTYCWEQYNLGEFGADFSATSSHGPIFRSFDPTASRTRIFPTLEKLLVNQTNYLGEKLPEVARRLTFRLTVRDIKGNYGIINFPDDSVVLNVVNTGNPFAVTGPNTKNDYWQIGSSVTVTWDVATTTTSPINCSNVDILLSLDDGHTYTHVLAANTANDGSETITVPNAPTASARVKVKGAGNVFFDISNAPFCINNWPAHINESRQADWISIYPVPATDQLHIKLASGKVYTATVINALGQRMHQTQISGATTFSVKGWPQGMYNVKLTSETGEMMNRNFTVQ
jgi:hypothetical protein